MVTWSDESHFFPHHMDKCECIPHLEKTWHQDALWEDNKRAEPVWSLGLCSAGKTLFLSPGSHMDITLTCTTLLQTYYGPSWKRNSLMAVASCSRTMRPETKQKWCVLASKFPNNSQYLLTSWYQILHHTFRGVVESMPQGVRADLAAKGEPVQYLAAGYKVIDRLQT